MFRIEIRRDWVGKLMKQGTTDVTADSELQNLRNLLSKKDKNLSNLHNYIVVKTN